MLALKNIVKPLKLVNTGKKVNYSKFVKTIQENKVEKVVILPNKSKIIFEDVQGNYGISDIQVNDRLLGMMENNAVDITFEYDSMLGYGQIVIQLTILILMIKLFFKNRGTEFKVERNMDVKFEDVAGIEGEKYELQELVNFIKNPEKYEKVGAVVPRGCLISGPPGIGKTLLAKAVAGEANVPYISTSGSEFVELFVGLGASRIRSLFKQARENAPCVIFIDEIDTLGKSRTTTMHGNNNEEREQTLNQLLTEMDGFANNHGIIILAATNREDILDKALLRPGRFDRKLNISLPTYEGRLKILKLHAKNKKIDDKLENLILLARKSIGCNGAELKNILNEASILAARNGRDGIIYDDLNEAFDKTTIGLPNNNKTISQRTKTITAYHEAGHALLGKLLEKHYDQLTKVSIVARGNTGGITQFTANEDYIDGGMYTKEYLFNKIVVGLGGRVAEQLIFGEDFTTTGATNDLKMVSTIARRMVDTYGFSESVLIVDDKTDTKSNEYLKKIDLEASTLILKAQKRARNLLHNNMDKLELLATKLLEKEILHNNEINELMK